jgi:hypothetical protein
VAGRRGVLGTPPALRATTAAGGGGSGGRIVARIATPP